MNTGRKQTFANDSIRIDDLGKKLLLILQTDLSCNLILTRDSVPAEFEMMTPTLNAKEHK